MSFSIVVNQVNSALSELRVQCASIRQNPFPAANQEIMGLTVEARLRIRDLLDPLIKNMNPAAVGGSFATAVAATKTFVSLDLGALALGGAEVLAIGGALVTVAGGAGYAFGTYAIDDGLGYLFTHSGSLSSAFATIGDGAVDVPASARERYQNGNWSFVQD